MAGLLAAVLLVVYVLITQANDRNARAHSESNLEIGARVFDEAIDQRIESLANSASVMSQDYAIKQVLLQDKPDEHTLSSSLRSYTQRVQAPVIALFDPAGQLLANSSGDMDNENRGPFANFLIPLANQQEKLQASGFAYLNKQLHVLVVVPLYAPFPDVSAWFGLAFPIDAAFAQKIKSTTQLEVTFISTDDPGHPRVLASTLPPAEATLVAEAAAANLKSHARLATLNLPGERYVTLFKSMDMLGDDPVTVVLQRPLSVELAPARKLEKTILYISFTALFGAILVALWIARGVSQPVQQLATFTKRVAAGDYTQRIALDRADELGQLATAFNQMTAGLADRDRVRDLLGKVVSPEIAAQLLQSDVQLGGEEREVTILFCDLRNFTGMSEKMPASEVLTLLNRYLNRMSTIIEAHGGVIDKYIGDAIMALYGAPLDQPDAARRALDTARVMADSLHELNLELVAEGKPRLEFGIGINTGRVVAGNMGSNSRLNYTVIGDGVNLASRLETLTKDPAYQTSVIVSEAAARASGQAARLRSLGEITVKGKTEAVKILALDIQTRPWPETS